MHRLNIQPQLKGFFRSCGLIPWQRTAIGDPLFNRGALARGLRQGTGASARRLRVAMERVAPDGLRRSAMIWIVALVLSLVGFVAPFAMAQDVDATVTLLNGEAIRGKLLTAEATQVSIQAAEGKLDKASGDISRVSTANKMEPQKQPIEVLMLDGSRAYGDKLVGKSTGFQLQSAAKAEIAISAKAMKAVRLKPIVAELEEGWQTAIKETKDSDAVIVVRPGNAIDRINGIIVEVRESDVAFELDGQQIDIPIAKLLGLVWFQRTPDRVKPSSEVVTTNHSTWLADTLLVKGNQVDLQTSLGQKVSFPTSMLATINYATANIRWLAELESIEAVADKQMEFKTPVAALERSFSPRFVVNGRAPGAASLPADKDLYFPSPGRYVFRVPEGFTTLQCSIQRTDVGTHRTDLTIQVWQEDQRIAELPLAWDQDSIELNVPVPAGKKIKLAVACASKLMIGTEVQWKQPRLKR